MALRGQASTHEPQRMQSEHSRLPRCTYPVTSMLIGQAFVHVPQEVHRCFSVASRSAGHANWLRIRRPAIMNGAIQHRVWQDARRPTRSAGRNRTTSTINATTAACQSATEMPCQVRYIGSTRFTPPARMKRNTTVASHGTHTRYLIQFTLRRFDRPLPDERG